MAPKITLVHFSVMLLNQSQYIGLKIKYNLEYSTFTFPVADLIRILLDQPFTY
jgi:hypothetical protein